VEPLIKGTYQKFNSNTGFQANGFAEMAALSHFSYHFTKGKAFLCDLQGGCYSDCYVLTDPVIMSSCRKYGTTDLGQDGIDNFFFYHRCTSCCDSSWARSPNPRPLYRVCEGTSMSFGGQVRYGSRSNDHNPAARYTQQQSSPLYGIEEDQGQLDRRNPFEFPFFIVYLMLWLALMSLFVLSY